MMGWLLFFITCALEVTLAIYYYDSIMVYRWEGIRKALSYAILFAASAGNAIIIELLSPGFFPVKLLTLIAIQMLFVKICYRANWLMSGFFACSAIMLQILLETVIYGLLQIRQGGNQIFASSMGCVSCLILFGLLFLLRRRMAVLKEHLQKDSGTLVRFIGIPAVTVIAGLYFYVFFVSSSDMGYFEIFTSAALILINIGSMFIMQESVVKDEKLRKSEMQIESKQNQLQAFHDMQALYERQGRKLHDYKKQLATLQELLKDGDTDATIEFTEQLTKSIAVEMSEVNVGHPVVNAVFNQQYRVAKGKNIGMTFAVSDLHDIRLSDDDIVVLIGNLVENAIHECEKVISQGQTASIQVKLVEKDSRLIFTVRNPVVQRVAITDNKVRGVPKDGHGIGLSNVESVVEKYGGTFAISCDEKEFTAVAVM